MMNYLGMSVSFLFIYFLKQANIFGSFFSNNENNDEFTLGDTVLVHGKSRRIGWSMHMQ